MIINCIGGKSSYRSDIDGLRALACLAVVFYHAFPFYMKGGFVGVDIFFVISGYLISSILYRNLYDTENPGHVNIVDFYIRRVRRIFPALIAVLVFLLAVGWIILLPDEYKRLGKHVLGGSTYISNFILYYENGDYFNVDSNLKPLLHLWSLGVEEQFYLIFPIFLWVLYKLKLNILKWLLIFTSVSFFVNLYCVWSVSLNHVIHLPDLNFAFVLDKTGKGSYSFYMPWTRFWELSVGAILAYVVMFKPNITNKLQYKETTANALSIVGLLLILTSYLVIPQDINFPGYRASLPVLGALCIIAAGQKGIVNKKILSSKIFIFFGLISYPLYLWHWPLLSLGWICEGQRPDRWIRLTLVAISIILATLTFYFIEPPLRYGKAPKIKSVALFAVLLGLGAFGYTCYHHEGYRFRYEHQLTDEEKEIQEKTKKYKSDFGIFDDYIDNCTSVFPNWNYDVKSRVVCALNAPKGQKYRHGVSIIGDSHSAALFYELTNKLKNSNIFISLFPIQHHCPFKDIGVRMNGRTNWYLGINAAYDYIKKNKNIGIVLMTHKISGLEFDSLNLNQRNLYSIVYSGAFRSFNLLKLHNKNVVYIIDNPELPFVPKINLERKLFDNNIYSFDKNNYWNRKEVIEYNKAVKDAAAHFDNVSIVDTEDIFCDVKLCYSKLNVDGSFETVYLDKDHLNYKGARLVVPRIIEAIEKFENK